MGLSRVEIRKRHSAVVYEYHPIGQRGGFALAAAAPNSYHQSRRLFQHPIGSDRESRGAGLGHELIRQSLAACPVPLEASGERAAHDALLPKASPFFPRIPAL